MKKLISIILSLALVACMFGMSVMAANVVGSYKGPNQGTIDDGIAEDVWSGTASLEDAIKLNISGQHNRYAVDVTFSGNLTFGTGQWIWDVNNLQYYTTSPEQLTMSDTEYTFLVENYSNLPVDVTCSITEKDDFLDDAEITISLSNTIVASNTHNSETANADFNQGTTANSDEITGTLLEVETANTAIGSRAPTSVKFTANMTSEDWNSSVGKYLVHGKDQNKDSYILAKFTVTINKVSTDAGESTT